MTLPETALAIEGHERQEARAFLRAGTVAAMVVEVNRDSKKRSRPYSAEDIFPHIKQLLIDAETAAAREPKQSTQSVEQQIAMAKALMGGEGASLPRPKETD